MPADLTIPLVVAIACLAGVAALSIIVLRRAFVRASASERDMLKAVLATHPALTAQRLAGEMEHTDRAVEMAQSEVPQPPRPRLAQ